MIYTLKNSGLLGNDAISLG